MSNAFSTKNLSLQRKAAELTVAAPVVVAHRVGRMLVARGNPSTRDQKEFALMTSEKTEAMAEAWAAIGATVMRASQRNLQSGFDAWMNPRTYRELAMGRLPKALRSPWGRVGDDMVRATLNGLAPVHRRAVANAKRLSINK